jgi:hypothetical protein
MNARSRDRAPRAIVAFSVALLALVGAAIAAAGEGIKKGSATTTVAIGETGSSTATCKKGTKAVAGGYHVPPDSLTGLGAEAHEARRTAKREWTASSYNPGTGSTLNVFVYCRDERIKAVSSPEVAIAADGTIEDDLPIGTAIAKCPRGTKVVSGGFDNPDFAFEGGYSATNIRPYESRKIGKRKWMVSASNRSDTAGTLIAYAYCHEGKKLKTKHASESLALGGGGFPLDSATASCKRTQRAVSGGFASDEPADFGGPFFTGSRREGKRRWTVTAAANELGPAITAFVYCEKK